MFVPLGLIAALAILFPGPVAAYIGLLVGCAAMGSIVAAWASGLVAVWKSRGLDLGWRRAFFSADPGRWAFEGLAIGSAIGLVFMVLALLGV